MTGADAVFTTGCGLCRKGVVTILAEAAAIVERAEIAADAAWLRADPDDKDATLAALEAANRAGQANRTAILFARATSMVEAERQLHLIAEDVGEAIEPESAIHAALDSVLEVMRLARVASPHG